MLAKFQNIIVEAEKMEDLPAYYLSIDKKHIGTIHLDINRFYQCLDTSMNKPLGESATFAFDINPEDFKLLNYDIVTMEWVKELMEAKNLSISQVAEIANTSNSTVYRILEGKEISGPIKSSLFNFFNK